MNAQTLFWHLFSGEKVATLSRSLVRFCRFLLEKDTEMNEKKKQAQNYDESPKFPQELLTKMNEIINNHQTIMTAENIR